MSQTRSLKSMMLSSFCEIMAKQSVLLRQKKALVRKLDWMLIPLMAVVYNLQYLDKTICITPTPPHRFPTIWDILLLVNYANVMGISKDTHTNASQFSYLAMVFYVSYLFCEVPHGYLIQTLPIAKYLGACGIDSNTWSFFWVTLNSSQWFCGDWLLRWTVQAPTMLHWWP